MNIICIRMFLQLNKKIRMVNMINDAAMGISLTEWTILIRRDKVFEVPTKKET